MLSLLALASLASSAHASGNFTVGTFTKSTSAAPVSQAVAHGLGSAPKAIILWTNGKTGTTLGAGFLYGFGMSDGTTNDAVATEICYLALAGQSSCRSPHTQGDRAPMHPNRYRDPR